MRTVAMFVRPMVFVCVITAVTVGAATVQAAGAFAFMAPQMPHFVWVEGETVVQLNGEGPWGITYLNPSDACDSR
jgi:ABC-type enterobactin transport system permease subunit